MRQKNNSVERISIPAKFNRKQSRGAVALAVAAVAATSATVMGAAKTWTATTSGNWSTAASWGGTAPLATGDTINVTNPNAITETITFDNSAVTTSLAALTVGAGSATFSGAVTLLFPSGSAKTLAVVGATTVGGVSTNVSGKGIIQQDGATFNPTTLNIGGSATLGIYNQTAGTLNAATENIGLGAAGSFTQSGGLHTSPNFALGNTSAGTYTLSGTGILTATTENEAFAATGISNFIQNGGTHNATTLNMANDQAATANYTLNSGTLSAATETIANAGTATFSQTGGTHTNAGTLSVGAQGTAFNTLYTMTGGVLQSANQIWANAGVVTMNQSVGTNTVNGGGATDSFTLGAQANSQATYTLTSGAINVTAVGGAVIGKAGNGTLNQNGGTFTMGAGRDLSIGAAVTASGSYSLNNGSFSAGGNVYVGGTSAAAGGFGNLTIGGNATASIPGTLKIWNDGSSVALNSGTLTVNNIDTDNGSNGFLFSGGTLNLVSPSGATIGTGTPLSGNVQLNTGQTLNVTNGLTFGAGGSMSMTGGALSTSTITGPAGSISFVAGNLTLTANGLTIDGTGLLGNTVSLPTGSSIVVSGALANNGSVTLSGGAIGGASIMTNTSSLTGLGSITGAGGLTNSGLIGVSGGNLTVSKTGTFTNTTIGIIDVDASCQLQINGGDLQNSGTINLDGGGVVTSTTNKNLVNGAGGLITGSGTIAVQLQNSGTIAIGSKTLNINNPFTNSGVIRLGDITARLTSGDTGVTNAVGGSITGVGSIGAQVNNFGYIEAIGGVLQLAGATTNSTGGTLASSTGTQLYITGNPGANSGTISLTGGTLHLNNQPYINGVSGVISGYGTIRTGGTGLQNSGQMLLAGGSTLVYGAVTSTNGSKIIVSAGSNATFFNPVTINSGAEFRVSTAATAVFFGPVTGQANFTGSGVKDFEAGGSALIAALSTPGSTVVQQGASLSVPAIRESSLSVSGNVNIPQDGTSAGTSKLGTISVTDGGKLDLSNNKLIVTNGSVGSFTGTSYEGVTGLLASGRNGGAWNGSGIVTSMTAAKSPNLLTTLAVATAGDVGKTSFGGMSVTSTDVLVMYTYTGDSNLTGKIDADDYFQIDSHYNKFANSAKSYYNGDFNYDGKINGDDYFLIDAAYAGQGSPISGSETMSGVTAVPEPASIALVAGAMGLGLRRRRSTR